MGFGTRQGFTPPLVGITATVKVAVDTLPKVKVGATATATVSVTVA